MKSSRAPMARILNHDSGLGTPSADTVRQRALELAEIDGRKEATAGDWVQAKAELHGGLVTNGDADDEMTSSVSERDMIVTDRGHHVQNIHHDDAEHALEELVAEGMEEAVHEQMLEASRQATAQDLEA